MDGMGWSLDQTVAALRRGEWDYIDLGDDMVVLWPVGFKFEGLPTYGFEATTVPNTIAFLSKFYDPKNPVGHGLVSRMYNNTINKEVRMEPRTIEVAALGYYERSEVLKGHPAHQLYRDAMMARPRTRLVVELADRIKVDALREAVMLQALEGNWPSYALKALSETSSALAGRIDARLRAAGDYGIWHDYADPNLPVSAAINDLVVLGQQSHTRRELWTGFL
uniref:Uncharacterized protein n=1 Tax=viral metagenome TaxID=1070528 RepID=A0A2V0RKC8_9ZZZZ